MWKDAPWRSSQIGAMFSTSWEQKRGDWCLLDASGNHEHSAESVSVSAPEPLLQATTPLRIPDPHPTTASCAQGNTPTYGVIVTDPLHIIQTVGFARRHGLKLRVKGTGHDFLGRSTDGNAKSLLIWTHRLRGITLERSKVICGRREDVTVAVAAGERWGAVYEALQKEGRVVPGGADPDVGASGGQVMGGGHSPLSNTYGLTTDSILQFRIVTTDGRLLVASPCQDEELFWAMRGGGGGTYAIVLETTFRTYEDRPMALARIDTSVTDDGYGNALDVLGMLSPSLADDGWTGYFYLFESSFQAVFFLPLLHNGSVTFPSARQSITKLFRHLSSRRGLTTHSSSIRLFPSFEDARKAGITTGTGGNSNIIGSRLIPRRMLENGVSRYLISRTLASIKSKTGRPILGHFVAGNSITSNWGGGGNDNAVHPAWREAIWHMVVLNTLPQGGSREEVQRTFEYLTREQVEPLRVITPGGGAYGNEGDPHALSWKEDFFGVNYQRLLAIKERYDRDGLLICNRCVGSEEVSGF
jgi:hypothetical protein